MPKKDLHPGDPCPNCGSELQAAPVPSDDEFRKAFDRENPTALPLGSDTANPDQRAELGALYRCTNPRCRYAARFHEHGESGDEHAADEAGDRAPEERPSNARRSSARR